MSTFRDRTVTCDECGTVTELSLAVSVNGERSAEYRAEIMAGTFQIVECSGCGQKAQADGPLLYVEMNARRWIGCFPRAWEVSWRHLENEPLDTWRNTMIDHAPASMRKMSDGFSVRTVFGLPALREKLVCFDSGLDDRLVEALKLDIMRQHEELIMHPRARPLLVEVTGDELTFVADKPAGQLAASELAMDAPWRNVRLGVPRVHYDRLDASSADWASVIRKVSGGPYVDLGRIMLDGTAELLPGAELA